MSAPDVALWQDSDVTTPLLPLSHELQRSSRLQRCHGLQRPHVLRPAIPWAEPAAATPSAAGVLCVAGAP